MFEIIIIFVILDGDMLQILRLLYLWCVFVCVSGRERERESPVLSHIIIQPGDQINHISVCDINF